MVKKVSDAGKLLIRAAAALGTLSPEDQTALDEATDHQLSGCIALALGSARDVSKSVAKGLKMHPPAGFWRNLNGED